MTALPCPRLPARLSCALVLALGLAAVGAAPAADRSKPLPSDGGPQLISKGPRWKNVTELRRFAAEGDTLACLELGERLLAGNGVAADPVAARGFFARAASAGSGDAAFRLGKLYHDAIGGERDYGRAIELYAQAAHAGIPEAQHNIGAMLVSARGVKRDYVEGLAWLIVAMKNGAVSDAEQRTRERLKSRPASIAEAEERAKELWKALADPKSGDEALPRYALAGAVAPPVSKAAPKIAPPKPQAPDKVKVDLAPPLTAPKPQLDLPKN